MTVASSGDCADFVAAGSTVRRWMRACSSLTRYEPLLSKVCRSEVEAARAETGSASRTAGTDGHGDGVGIMGFLICDLRFAICGGAIEIKFLKTLEYP